MVHRRRKKYGWLVMIILLMTAGVLFLFTIPESPEIQLREAREGIAQARDAQAEHYARDPFEKAISSYDSAMSVWRAENKKFLLFRNYEKASDFAVRAEEFALLARATALRNARDAHNETAASLELLTEKIGNFGKLYADLPLNSKIRDSFNRAKILLEEIRVARERKNFIQASGLLSEALRMVDSADSAAAHEVEIFFSSYDVWKELADKALKESVRNNSVVIVVDKMAHQLMIYRGGHLRSTYPVEFGPNWMGDKRHQGDQATPEGRYQVVKKKEKRQTRYYKALLLNYPNEDDKARYRSGVASGRIPKSVDIGGLIEIHGHGGQGFNWTNGCVALSDHHMDAVYRQASVSTPIIIAGSLVPMDEWMGIKLAENSK